jgi:nitrite reductase/ring-hydroxylating ferredoxin subunit
MPRIFTEVCRVEEVPLGTGQLVMGPFDKPMALFNVDGEFFVINAICPHMGGPLQMSFAYSLLGASFA